MEFVYRNLLAFAEEQVVLRGFDAAVTEAYQVVRVDCLTWKDADHVI